MVNKLISMTLVAAAAINLVASEVKPLLHWNFASTSISKPDAKQQRLLSQNSIRKTLLIAINPNYSLKDGVLRCSGYSPKKYHRIVNVDKISADAATIDLIFRVNAPINRKSSLLCYEEWSWARAQLKIYLTKASELAISFKALRERTKKQLLLRSKPIKFVPGKFYTVRATMESGKMLRLYCNGALVAETNKAFSFSDFSLPMERAKALFSVGCSNERGGRPTEHFNGAIREISIYDRALAPTQNKDDCAADGESVSIVFRRIETSPKIDGELQDDCYCRANWTRPFMLLGKESKDVYGVWLDAESKYSKSVAVATLLYNNKYLYVAYKVRFPKGMKPLGNGKWSRNNDFVEFFVKPGPGPTYQILVDSTGNCESFRYGAFSKIGGDWKPKNIQSAVKIKSGVFQVEVAIPLEELGFEKPPAPGTMWRGNFTRTGPTCGGLSTWAPVGPQFMSPEAFGYLICESQRAYLEKRMEKFLSLLNGCHKAKTILGTEFKQLCADVQSTGDQRSQYLPLSNRLKSFRNRLFQVLNADQKLIVWPSSSWKNFPPNVEIPFGTAPLSSLTLTAPLGARAINSFRVTNLTNRAALSVIKVKGAPEIVQRLRVREVGFIELKGGRMVPDPIFDLPAGEVLRTAPYSTSMVWLDLNCTGLKAGKYHGELIVYPGYSGFNSKTIRLTLEVSPIDISKDKLHNFTYTIEPKKGRLDPLKIDLTKNYLLNTITILPPLFVPPLNRGFETVDTVIKQLDESGTPREKIMFLLWADFNVKSHWSPLRVRNKLVRFGDPRWKAEFKKRLLRFRDYLKERYNMGYSQFAIYTYDEPRGDPADTSTTAYNAIEGAKFIRTVDPKIQLFVNLVKSYDYVKEYAKWYDILVPAYPHLLRNPKMFKVYRDSKREIWTYWVLSKNQSCSNYREIFWGNLLHGFSGCAAFYTMWRRDAGDAYNSYDHNPKTPKRTIDYSTLYVNKRTSGVSYSRRMESWYCGLIDFKLARFCRARIAAGEKSSNMAWAKDALTKIIAAGNDKNQNIDEVSLRLLRLAEKLRQGAETR